MQRQSGRADRGSDDARSALPPRRSDTVRPPGQRIAPLAMAVAWIGALTLLTGLALSRSDRILPGIAVAGVPVGLMRMEGAALELARSWADKTVVVVSGDGSATTTLAALGFRLDEAATAWAAHQRGRTLSSAGLLVRGGDPRSVAPVWSFEPATAASTLAQLAEELDVAARAPELEIRDGRVVVRPGTPGTVMDRAASLMRLQAEGADVVARGRFEATSWEVAADGRDLDGAAAEASRRLEEPVVVRAYDPVHDRVAVETIAPEIWSGWVRPVADPERPARVHWEVAREGPPAALRLDAAEWSPEHYVDGSEVAEAVAALLTGEIAEAGVRLRHDPVKHAVRPGETVAGIAEQYGIPYPYVIDANEGLGDDVWPGQEIEIPSPDGFLPLPAVEGKRIVVSLSEQELGAFEDGAVRWRWPVSTGIASSPTSPGVFQVQSHEPNAYASNWDLWMPHFVGIYHPLPGAAFLNGFHGFPTRDGRALLWTGSLGQPVTYGCVLLSTENAALLYDWAEDGVVVEIRR